MAKVSENNFLTIEGWMRTALNLSGNELLVFAVIYQFSQGKAGRYIGGLPYLADWCGCHADTARRAVRALEERGLILAQRGEVNGIPYCNYIVCEESLQNARVSSQNTTDTLANCEGDTRKMQGITINKTININSRSNNIGDFDFRSELIRIGVSAEVADAWLEIRRKAKAVNSKIAFKEICTELGKVEGMTPDECIRKAVARNWRGFEADWVQKTPTPQAPRPRPRYESPEEHNLRVLRQMQERDGMLHTFTPDEQ